MKPNLHTPYRLPRETQKDYRSRQKESRATVRWIKTKKYIYLTPQFDGHRTPKPYRRNSSRGQ